MLSGAQGHVRFRADRRLPLYDRRSDESAPSLRHHGQRGEMVAEERRQLAQLRPSATSLSLPLCRQPEGAPVCAGGLDAAGTHTHLSPHTPHVNVECAVEKMSSSVP